MTDHATAVIVTNRRGQIALYRDSRLLREATREWSVLLAAGRAQDTPEGIAAAIAATIRVDPDCLVPLFEVEGHLQVKRISVFGCVWPDDVPPAVPRESSVAEFVSFGEAAARDISHLALKVLLGFQDDQNGWREQLGLPPLPGVTKVVTQPEPDPMAQRLERVHHRSNSWEENPFATPERSAERRRTAIAIQALKGDPNLTPTLVAMLITDRSGRVLMAQNPPGAQGTSLWSPPSGRMLRNEPPQGTAQRILESRVGLHFTDPATIVELFTVPVGSPSTREIRVLAVLWSGSADKLSVPGATDVRLLEPQEALTLPCEHHVRRIITRYRLGIRDWNRIRGLS
ncbi:NUDIX domain-containing protein [Kitasatospora sp. NPDC002040]|uniref:NUDIX hydrolase n=1 Tax=Kitasatospora sp. NPDC002040 TaxID=3154661 RepID=UPI003332E255